MSVGRDGSVWIIGGDDSVWQRTETGGWVRIGGALDQISHNN
ncbi:MAG: hypothetical protein AAGE88_06540 [Actinomycetota bacterium]